jgi:hypothetical protein
VVRDGAGCRTLGWGPRGGTGGTDGEAGEEEEEKEDRTTHSSTRVGHSSVI